MCRGSDWRTAPFNFAMFNGAPAGFSLCRGRARCFIRQKMNAIPQPLWSALWRGGEIRVFSIGEEAALSLAEAADVLNGEERARAARFHFETDRARWMRSRALLRMGLAERLGMTAREVVLVAEAGGKLRAGGTGRVEFNLSHSGDFMALALGEVPVGIDIEVWQPDLPVADLAGHEFRPEEAAAIVASAEPLRLFYQLWTAKEAVMKCTGLGLSLPPAAIVVEGGGARRTDVEPAEAFALFAYEVPGRFTLAAAHPVSPATSSLAPPGREGTMRGLAPCLPPCDSSSPPRC